jgi:hypothetical protein
MMLLFIKRRPFNHKYHIPARIEWGMAWLLQMFTELFYDIICKLAWR